MCYPISVVVPTKNRYKYLKKLVDLIIGFETEELELVIQDNSDNNQEIVEWLKDKDYSWIKYFYCSGMLTTIQNFDKAINNATGDYICFIGDDDGVVRNIVDCAKWMKKNNVESLRSAKCEYDWPEIGPDGGTVYETINRNVVEYLNPVKELVKILKNGCQTLGNIPVTYVGIVKRTVLKNIYEDFGTYFPGGASADIANGVALCFYVKRYVKLNIPILITGTSKQTGSVSDRKRLLNLSEIPFIAQEYGNNWEGDLPKYWLNRFVWPESAIKSLRAIHKESFITFVNYDKIIAAAIIFAKLKASNYYSYCTSPASLWLELLKRFSKRYFNAIMNRVAKLMTGGRYLYKQSRYTGVNDIISAEKVLSKTKCINFDTLEY